MRWGSWTLRFTSLKGQVLLIFLEQTFCHCLWEQHWHKHLAPLCKQAWLGGCLPKAAHISVLILGCPSGPSTGLHMSKFPWLPSGIGKNLVKEPLVRSSSPHCRVPVRSSLPGCSTWDLDLFFFSNNTEGH